jgi:hypothetical protein
VEQVGGTIVQHALQHTASTERCVCLSQSQMVTAIMPSCCH